MTTLPHTGESDPSVIAPARQTPLHSLERRSRLSMGCVPKSNSTAHAPAQRQAPEAPCAARHAMPGGCTLPDTTSNCTGRTAAGRQQRERTQLAQHAAEHVLLARRHYKREKCTQHTTSGSGTRSARDTASRVCRLRLVTRSLLTDLSSRGAGQTD